MFSFSEIRGEQIGTHVRAFAYISGESGQKAIYASKEAECRLCKEKAPIDIAADPTLLYKLLSHEKFPIKIPDNVGNCKEGKSHHWEVSDVDPPLMFQEVFLRENMDSTEIGGRSMNRDYHGFVLGLVPECKDVTLDGIPFANSRNFDVEFLVNKALPKASSIDAFELMPEEIPELRKFFAGRETLAQFNQLAEAVNPRISRHTDAKLAVLLAYCSPCWIEVNGQLRPGTLRVLLFGDPRQGKGSIADYLRLKLSLGKHAIGETSSRTGITYTIDRDKGIIIWGVMVEADRGLVVLEALHKFPPDDLATMRETLVKLYVEVRRSFTSKAWARTRVIADSNGRQELSLYIFLCQAVRDLPMFKDQVDLTRWDAFIPFRGGDIDAESILNAQLQGVDDVKFLESVRKLSLWVWSRRPKQIKFTAEAMNEARESFKTLLKDYALSDIPIIHEDSLLTLLKIATSFAALSFSTSDGINLDVKELHVRLARDFLIQTLDALEIKEYRQSRGDNVITKQEREDYYAHLGSSDVAVKVTDALAKGPKNSLDLEVAIGHKATSIRHTCAQLKAMGVIEKVSQGYRLTTKGVQLFKEFQSTKSTQSTRKEKEGILN